MRVPLLDLRFEHRLQDLHFRDSDSLSGFMLSDSGFAFRIHAFGIQVRFQDSRFRLPGSLLGFTLSGVGFSASGCDSHSAGYGSLGLRATHVHAYDSQKNENSIGLSIEISSESHCVARMLLHEKRIEFNPFWQ